VLCRLAFLFWVFSKLLYALIYGLLQKYFEVDDSFEENKRQNSEKISSLESIIRLFEVKMKNAQDQSKCFNELFKTLNNNK